jgi:transcription elongation factor Elf1
MCPMCNGEAGILGILGNVTWMLCRNCGMQFHLASPKDSSKGVDDGR